MAADPLTTGQKVGIAIFLLPHLLASIGHSWDVHPASAPEWYFVLLAISGLIGGILLGVDCRIGGALGGPVATFGAMFAVAAYLSQVEVAYNALVVIFGGLGALPGYGLYQLVKTMFFSSADAARGPKRIVLVSDEAHQVEPVKATVVEKKPGQLLLYLTEEGEIDPGTVLSIRPIYPVTQSWVRFIVRSREKVGIGWQLGVEFVDPPSPATERMFA